MDASGLIQRLMTDPLSVVERTLEHALDQLADGHASERDVDMPAEELLGSALASRLSGVIGFDATPAPDDETGVDAREHDRLVDRNLALARALGACECWGAPRCQVCGGAGSPGWVMPDERLFSIYVQP